MCKKEESKVLKCVFKEKNTNANTLHVPFIIEICKETNTIKGPELGGCPIWHSHLKEILDKHLKSRIGDILNFHRCSGELYKFSKYEDHYGQVQKRIFKALKHKYSKIVFTYEINKEILCNCCNQNWFTPVYTHINMCEDCSDCLFD
jgi:hypothetical protein